ncbi:unnamed protein product [Choristocarpus tenellus]
MSAIQLECSLEGVESAVQAQQGGAHRVELCSNLIQVCGRACSKIHKKRSERAFNLFPFHCQGGTTPSIGDVECTVLALRGSQTRVHVLIRPRPGNFIYTSAEIEVMVRDVEAVKNAGAHGVVIGALLSDGTVDKETIAKLVKKATPAMTVTFHRAFDCCMEPFITLRALVRLGVDRVLTSGQASTAWEGRDVISKLVEASQGQVAVMPGAGVNKDNIRQLMEHTGAKEVHVGSACHDDAIQSGMINLGQAFQGDATLFLSFCGLSPSDLSSTLENFQPIPIESIHFAHSHRIGHSGLLDRESKICIRGHWYYRLISGVQEEIPSGDSEENNIGLVQTCTGLPLLTLCSPSGMVPSMFIVEVGPEHIIRRASAEKVCSLVKIVTW